MSYLRIKTRSGQVVNPRFSKIFVSIAEDNTDAPINMTCVDPLVLNDLAQHESIQENTDIQNMAVFLLISNEMLGVKWGNRYYFGDVDLMDNYDFDENMDDVTLIQYCIEDEVTLKTLLTMFRKIDNDCMRDGADSIPFSDFEYYSEQIQNIYDFDEPESMVWAEKLRKFDVFKKSGKDVPDIKKYTDAYGEDPSQWKGRAYLIDPTDTCGLTIESTKDWDEEHQTHNWHLLIANQEWMSNDLEELELELFDFAESAGWTDDL